MKVFHFKILCLILALLLPGAGWISGQRLSLQHLTSETELADKPKKKKKKKKKSKKSSKDRKPDSNPTNKDKKLDDDDNAPIAFKDRLWYGGGVGFGFGSNQSGSLFSLGVSPMVGYKIWGPFSAGPRFSITLNSEKRPGLKAANLFDYEAGVFLRSKIFGPIFAHGEVGSLWQQFPVDYDFNNKKWKKETQQTANQFIGLGYNNGSGGAGFEILVLYNFRIARDENTIESPFSIRMGLTWRF